jgi:hypothetical protein
MFRLILILLVWMVRLQADKPVLPVAPAQDPKVGKTQMVTVPSLPTSPKEPKRQVVAEAERYKSFVDCKDQRVGKPQQVKPDWPLKKQPKDGFYHLD